MSVTLVDSMGSDLSVVNAARVSFAKESEWEQEQWSYSYGAEDDDPYSTVPLGGFIAHGFHKKLSEKDQKLIAYLAKHNHWTPFAHAFLSFRIKAPIFVARQLVKHQVGLAWNEVSRRYVDDEPEFWFPEVWRGKPVNAKQGSSDEVVEEVTVDDLDGGKIYTRLLAQQVLEPVLWAYQDMIDSGVAPEQARMILPQNMMTEWIWSGSLAAFARVCKLRLDRHAQQETREVAQQINDLVPQGFEHSWKALIN